MEPKIRTIVIETILGGHSPTTHFGSQGQFRASLGIDPAQPIDDLDTNFSSIASGLLRPAASQKFSGSVLNAAPLWMIPNPKNSSVYVLDALGSAYTIDVAFSALTAISDAGELTNGLGNGGEYYDNYIYFAKNTTIARLGPLNGATTLNGDYWVSSLAQTAMVNTAYPTDFKTGIQLPNHVMKRHSDGILYITDVVDNQGAIHKIQTGKTTVEGDTNIGSSFLALDFGYGLWPTALESYGADLAIALFEGSGANLRQSRAKLAFWDTSATSPNKITWVEFPDQIITGMKNINGTLYVISGNINAKGFRLSRFIGGYSFEEVGYYETGAPCLAGAIDGTLNRLLMGSFTAVPDADGCVYSSNLQKNALGRGLFNVMRATGGDSSTCVTAVNIADNDELGFVVPIIGWSKGSGTSNNGFDKQVTQYNNAPSIFWSQMFRVGQPFKIRKITIPLAQSVIDGMNVIPKIYMDDGMTNKELNAINWTNYPNKKVVALRPDACTGENNFWLELKWTGATLLTVGLPITIEIELIDI